MYVNKRKTLTSGYSVQLGHVCIYVYSIVCVCWATYDMLVTSRLKGLLGDQPQIFENGLSVGVFSMYSPFPEYNVFIYVCMCNFVHAYYKISTRQQHSTTYYLKSSCNYVRRSFGTPGVSVDNISKISLIQNMSF